MSSRFLSVCLLLAVATSWPAFATPLRICADPDNLPFSNSAGHGFDNRIAALVANELHRQTRLHLGSQRPWFSTRDDSTGTLAMS